MALRKITAEMRHYSDFEWLQTYWLFSFAEYYERGLKPTYDQR